MASNDTKKDNGAAQQKAEQAPKEPKLGAHATRYAKSLNATQRKSAEAKAMVTAKKNGVSLISIEMLGVANGVGKEGSEEVKALRRAFGPPSSKSKPKAKAPKAAKAPAKAPAKPKVTTNGSKKEPVAVAA